MIASKSIAQFDRIHVTTIIGRVLMSAIFLVSGVNKLMDPAATIQAIQSVGLPFAIAGYVLAAGIEVLCGAALLAGFALRWAAGVLAAFTFAAAIFFHSAIGDPEQVTHFLKNLSLTGGLLYVIALESLIERIHA